MSTKSLRDRNIKPKIRYRLSIVFFITLISICATFALYMKNTDLEKALKDSVKTGENSVISPNNSSNDLESSDSSTSKSDDDSESIDNKPGDKGVNPVPLSDKVDEKYLDDTAFVGDSITFGLSTYGMVSTSNVLANMGMNIEKVSYEKISTINGELTVLEALKKNKPKNIYIMLGSNGVGWLSNDKMIGYYTDFLKDIKKELPKANIYILSIPPVTSEREEKDNKAITNDKIDKYNSELLKLANSHKIHFVDLNTALKNNSGKLDVKMAERDGMHFKKSTYDTMIEYILTHTA